MESQWALRGPLESERSADPALGGREFDAPVNLPARVCVGG